MKNVLNLLSILCLFTFLIFTSCGKDNSITDLDDAITTQDASAFMQNNPTVNEVKSFFANSPSIGNTKSLSELSLQEKEALNLDTDISEVSNRYDCGDILTSTFFYNNNGPRAGFFGHDYDGTSCYVTILKKGNTTIDWSYHGDVATIYYTTSVVNCGTYVAETWSMEHGCDTPWQIISSATESYGPECW